MSGSFITCHVLDTSIGKPAPGVKIHLQVERDAGVFENIAQREMNITSCSQTDADGRCKDLQIGGVTTTSRAGIYKLKFGTRQYFDTLGKQSFWPWVEILFEVAEDEHYHVPLLISPFSYTVYRGS